MKTSNLKFSILIAGLLLFSGCSESFLDVTQMGVQDIDAYFSTDQEVLQGLAAIYDNIQSNGLGNNSLNTLADENASGSTTVSGNQWWNFTFDASSGYVSGLYAAYYEAIYYCNVLIGRSTPDTDAKIVYIAEAKTIRAMYYTWLIMLWGTPPLVTSELSSDEFYQANTPTADLWAQVETDLLEAIAVLPLKSEQEDQGHISKGAAQALLGRAYLYQEKYDDAADVLDDLIDSDEYELWPEFAEVHREVSELGSESIFEICNIKDSNQIYYGGEGGPVWMFHYIGPRAEYFTSGNTGIYGGWGGSQPMSCIYDDFVAAGDVHRRENTILNETEVEAMSGSLRTSGGIYQPGTQLHIRYKLASFIDEIVDVNGNYWEMMTCPTNNRYIRYAEVLLNAAEAHNRKSVPDDTKAQEYVNEVRARATGLADLTTTGDDLFEDIKVERRLELCYEAFRWFDLVRWGDAADVLGDKGSQVANGDGTFVTFDEYGFVSGKNELLPFPEQELLMNPNCVQNPNW